MVYTTSEIEAFHDRELPNIGGIEEKLIGGNRKTIKLFAKELPQFDNHIGRAYVISEESYGGEKVLLGRA